MTEICTYVHCASCTHCHRISLVADARAPFNQCDLPWWDDACGYFQNWPMRACVSSTSSYVFVFRLHELQRRITVICVFHINFHVPPPMRPPIRPFCLLTPSVHTISCILLVHVMSLVPAFASCAVTRTIRRLPILSFWISDTPHHTSIHIHMQPTTAVWTNRMYDASICISIDDDVAIDGAAVIVLYFPHTTRTTQSIYRLAHSCWHSRCSLPLPTEVKFKCEQERKRKKKWEAIFFFANYLDQFSATSPSPMPLLLLLLFKSEDCRYQMAQFGHLCATLRMCGCWGMNIRWRMSISYTLCDATKRNKINLTALVVAPPNVTRKWKSMALSNWHFLPTFRGCIHYTLNVNDEIRRRARHSTLSNWNRIELWNDRNPFVPSINSVQ